MAFLQYECHSVSHGELPFGPGKLPKQIASSSQPWHMAKLWWWKRLSGAWHVPHPTSEDGIIRYQSPTRSKLRKDLTLIMVSFSLCGLWRVVSLYAERGLNWWDGSRFPWRWCSSSYLNTVSDETEDRSPVWSKRESEDEQQSSYSIEDLLPLPPKIEL